MPRVRVLPDDLVNRIAAGEVVERPASVVKELVENALDAGAQRIEVELEAGGRRRVSVSDDGSGMDEDDALLALERHATSKITDAEELDRVSTLGFRGEALPSIAAVSRFELLTCFSPDTGAVRVRVEGGRILGVEGGVRPRGTTVEVRDLFFNVPARRKFLRAAETELRHASEIVSAQALARPDVGFLVRHGSSVLLESPAGSEPPARLRDLARGKLDGTPAAFEEHAGEITVKGWVAEGRGRGKVRLFTIVNGRPVRDRLLAGAARRVLREAGEPLAGGWLLVQLEVPPDAVDVNVHPTKAEVRFTRSGAVFGAVERAVRRGLTAGHGVVAVRRGPESGLSQHRPPYSPGRPTEPGGVARELFGAGETAVPEWFEPSGAGRTGEPDRFSTPFGRLLGQLKDSFLLVEGDRGLLVVDQHVAHERVLYDRFRDRLNRGERASQRLLEPLLVDVDPALVETLPEVADALALLGIEADRFADDTVRVSALPPEIDPGPAAELILEMLDRGSSLAGAADGVAEGVAHELAAALSCRAAIKINHHLSGDEQRSLLDDLARASDPYRCPHGRPIVIELGMDEMERRFGRR